MTISDLTITRFFEQIDIEHFIEQIIDYVLDVFAGERSEFMLVSTIELLPGARLKVQCEHVFNFLGMFFDIFIL